MRLAVVSDIHGNLPALQAVVADATARGATAWVNLGDIVSGPLWPAETAAWLMEQDGHRGWPTLAGNHERQVLAADLARLSAADRHAAERLSAADRHAADGLSAADRYAAERLTPAQRAWLAALPPQLLAPHGLAGRADAWAVHGTPHSDLHYLLETVTPAGARAATADELRQRCVAVPAAVTLLLCGHSHVARSVVLARAGGPPLCIVNPGSVGLPAFDDDHPWPHVAEAGTPHARYALVTPLGDEGGGIGRWHVDLCAVAYDWEAAARQAESQGRGDWADALRSGRVGRREAEISPA
jgi:predicted phosphodiesterase